MIFNSPGYAPLERSLLQLTGATASISAFFPDEKCRGPSEVEGSSLSSSSGESMSGPPQSRLVPGHRIWANGNGRHILGLIEDYRALRKQISDGRKLSRSLIAQQQECVQIFRQSSSDKVLVCDLSGFSFRLE